MTIEKTATELAAEFKSDFAKAHDAVCEIAENALGKAKSGEALTKTAVERSDEALMKMNVLSEKMAGLEQRMSRHAPVNDRAKSYGEQFVDDESFKSFISSGARNGSAASLLVKAPLSSLTTNVDGAVGNLINPDRAPEITPLGRRAMTIRQLLSQGQTTSNAVEFMRQTGYNNRAAMHAEGTTKAQSDIKMAMATAPVRTIAHTMNVPKTVLDDIAQLRSYIDGDMLYGLDFLEEIQLLSGDGTGNNLLGIIPQATAFVAPVVIAGQTSIDMIRQAMLQAALSEYPASATITHPSEWMIMELAKETGTGRYILGNPQGVAQPTLWGLPVVTTQSIAVDKFLVGSFRAGKIFDRWESRIELGYDGNDFSQNKVTILAEKRLALAVTRPEAFVFGDFGRVA